MHKDSVYLDWLWNYPGKRLLVFRNVFTAVFTCSYTIMCSYNYRNHYALLSYLEYPIILIQEIILITLVLHYKNCLNSQSLILAFIYFLTAASFFLGYIPREFITFLVVSSNTKTNQKRT